LGKQALALFPFATELAAVAIALDMMLLLTLLGAPQALIGMARRGRQGGRPPRRVDEAKSESLSSASVSEATATRVGPYTVQSSQSAGATPAAMLQVNSESEAALEPLADEIHASALPAEGAIEEEVTATPSRTPSLRRSEKLKAAIGRQLRWVSDFRKRHPDTAWVLGGTAIAMFLGYLSVHL
jgi:hypothetical protein